MGPLGRILLLGDKRRQTLLVRLAGVPVRGRLRAGRLEENLRNDLSDPMQRLVPCQPFRLEARHGVPHRFFAKRDLVFNDDVYGRVKPGVGQRDALLVVVLPHEQQALIFIQLEPPRGVRRPIGVVGIHRPIIRPAKWRVTMPALPGGAAMRWILTILAALAATYVVLFATVLTAMLQPPERFGLFMRYMPGVVVWRGLPAPRMWLWARRGTLSPGDLAPDFTLPTLDRRERVTLSSHRGRRPVVLVFGSYT